MRYTIEVNQVDKGFFTVTYSTRKDAIASAGVLAKVLSDRDDFFYAVASFNQIKSKNCQWVSFEPRLKQWCITIIKHS